jgi:hypothetical protein
MQPCLREQTRLHVPQKGLCCCCSMSRSTGLHLFMRCTAPLHRSALAAQSLSSHSRLQVDWNSRRRTDSIWRAQPVDTGIVRYCSDRNRIWHIYRCDRALSACNRACPQGQECCCCLLYAVSNTTAVVTRRLWPSPIASTPLL